MSLFAVLVMSLTSLSASTLFPNPVYPVGQSPLWIGGGDFDGNGVPDVVVTDFYDDDVRVFLNEGSGSLGATADITVGSNPFATAAADLDGDGDDDLIVANYGSGDLFVLLSDGDGTFTPGAGIPAGSQPNWLCAGDLDGDARIDVAVVLRGDNSVLLMRGDGHGDLSPSGSLTPGISPGACVLADFDGDGARDLAVTNTGSNDLSLFRGVGDGSFHPHVRYPVGRIPESIAAADLDLDGRLDLVTGNAAGDDVSVLFGRVDGTFDPERRFATRIPGTSVAAADLDADGVPDIIVANYGLFGRAPAASLLHGNGNRTFAAPQDPGLPSPFVVATEDLDTDGVQDLLATGHSTSPIYTPNELLIRRNGTGGAPPPPIHVDLPHGPADLAAADLDGDGILDLVSGGGLNSGSGRIVSLLGQGDGGFVPVTSIDLTGVASDVLPGDLDHDGRPDLVIRTWPDDGMTGIRVLLGQGDGTFVPGVDPVSTGNPISVALFDLDADGALDLIQGYPTAGTGGIGVRLGNDDGTFGAEHLYDTGPSPYAIEAADFNEDGSLDLMVSNGATTIFDAGFASILDGHGDGTFAPERRLAPFDAGRAHVGDMNGDGHADLVVTNALSLGIRVGDPPRIRLGSFVMLGDGHGEFPEVTEFARFEEIGSPLVLGDFDADGDTDIADLIFDALHVRLNDGTGVIGPDRRFQDAGLADALAGGDFDGDGRLDLAGGAVVIMLNGGPFPNAAPTAVAATTSPVECTSAGGTQVLLDGTASTDDGEIAVYEWFADFGTPGETLLGEGAVIQVLLPLGDHEVTLRVTDEAGLSGTDTLLVRVADTGPPSLTVTATPASIWPPNGEHHDVHVTAVAQDTCGPAAVTLVSVTSSEPDADAILDAEPGTEDFDVRLQADKKGSTRIYTLVYRAVDGSGHATLASAEVEVRKNKLRR